MKDLPLIDVYALGGTIAMTPDQSVTGQVDGVSPSLTADDLVKSIPQLEDIARIKATTLSNVASANLDFSSIKKLCDTAVKSDADAVVVTQGTDTLEETSFLAKLIYNGDKPIIFTGAMRAPNQLSSDGAVNLYAAVLTATKVLSANVFVVIDNQIHDPVFVEKKHTWALDAFRSEYGSCGYISEGCIFWQRPPSELGDDILELFHEIDAVAPIACISIALGDDGTILDLVKDKYHGLVIDAYGAGHVSEQWAERLKNMAQHLPVIIASQTSNGRVLEATYGYKGAEIDLFSNGMISAGSLNAKKARILLSLLVTKKTGNVKKSFTHIMDKLITVK
jgi:L-asparaginase